MPGLIAIAQSTTTSVFNNAAVQNGELEAGIAAADVTRSMYKGSGKFEGKPHEKLRIVANLPWVASTIVFHFVLFGVIAPRTGLGQLFIDNATILAGRYTDGPAKVSVVSSAFLGTISGASVANTVSTGTLTIPNVKRLGYPGHFAGGVAAAAFVYAQVLLFVSETGFALWEFSYTATSCIIGVISLSAAMVGYRLVPMAALSRWLLAFAGLVFIAPSLQADLLAAIIASPVIISQIIAGRYVTPTAG